MNATRYLIKGLQILFLLALVGCSGSDSNDNSTTSYSLTITFSGTGTGEVTSTPSGISCGSDCSENYEADEVVTLVATPSAGSEFTGWSGDADCEDNSVTMTSNISCNATFMVLDFDSDGWTTGEGDCNDNDANTNPGAIEVATEMGGTPADEDCDSQIDEIDSLCDTAMTISDTSPANAAKALDICQTTTALDDHWGIINSQYTRANGDAIDVSSFPAHGLLTDFGSNVAPQLGNTMLALSSGHARDAADANVCGTENCATYGDGTAPADFPQSIPSCEAPTSIKDDIAYEITLRAPTNATGFRLKYNFYTHDWPEWVCTRFSDQFVILMDPPVNGSVNSNIAIDSNAIPVSANSSIIDVCDASDSANYASNCTGLCPPLPNPYCPLGVSELSGTGYESSAGASSWEMLTVSVTSGQEFTLRFIIWDADDNQLDSTVLIDSFEWIANPGQ